MTISSKDIRRTIVKIVHDSGAAHIGSALSAVEILNAIFQSIDLDKIKKKDIARDRIILSKGHGTAVLYAIMYHYGLLADEEINTYFKNDSLLQGHSSHNVPFVEHSTGALGHGLPVGLGMAIGIKSRNLKSRVFVIVGDGELHEGSNWEAMMFAGHLKMNNLCLFVDRNKMSQIGELIECCDIEPLKSKIESFNFNIFEVDGHNESEICNIIQKTKNSEKPVAIICRTVKGKGVSFMENNNLWHYRAPNSAEYEKALKELE